MKSICYAIVLLTLVWSFLGCSGSDVSSNPSTIQHRAHSESSDTTWSSATVGMGGMGGMASGKNAMMGMNSSAPESDKDAELPAEIAKATPPKRRVIFDSKIEIKVSNFSGIESRISALVDRHGGFISEANVSHQAFQSRTGHWTIRVPVATYRQLLDSVGSFGELKSRKENAADVTAEFYDLEARIKNKQLLEQRIAKLLDETKTELRKMIEVERELARVREEIERMQGRIRFLADVTGMSTIHLKISEREKEPTPIVAATFSDRIGNAWDSALSQATNTTQNLIVTLVENVFRIAVACTMLLIAWLLAKALIWKHNRQQTQPA